MKNNFLRGRAWLLLIAAGVFAGSIRAAAPVAPVNAGKDKLAVRGYDPVAYFAEGKPVKGSPDLTFHWMGATWRFSTAEHRSLFQKSPEQYAPQFGGYCSWAVGHNYTAPADPEAWKIVDGKLYLNYNRDVQQKWVRDERRWITEANKNWPGLHQ
jgi:hypothetical protein